MKPQINLSSAFAVPFGRWRLPACEALNAQLEALFLARENDEHRNPSPSHTPQAQVFESRFNLFTWPEACVQQLRRFMLDTVARAVMEATALTLADFGRFKFQNQTWFHITRYAGAFVAHNHPLASWSAVYCVRAGEAGPSAGGVLRFFDPRNAANAYLDPGNARMRPLYAVAPLEMQLTAGEVVIFPSYLFHEVSPFYGSDWRITVASNCWFV